VADLDVAHLPGRRTSGLGVDVDVAGDRHGFLPDRAGPAAGVLGLAHLLHQGRHGLGEHLVPAGGRLHRQLDALAGQFADLLIGGRFLVQVGQGGVGAELDGHHLVQLVQPGVHHGIDLAVQPATGPLDLTHHPSDHVPGDYPGLDHHDTHPTPHIPCLAGHILA
jgi:hypothetical protein